MIWEYIPVTDEQRLYFNLTTFTTQLNHINLNLLDKICPTDSRFLNYERLRPD